MCRKKSETQQLANCVYPMDSTFDSGNSRNKSTGIIPVTGNNGCDPTAYYIRTKTNTNYLFITCFIHTTTTRSNSNTKKINGKKNNHSLHLFSVNLAHIGHIIENFVGHKLENSDKREI